MKRSTKLSNDPVGKLMGDVIYIHRQYKSLLDTYGLADALKLIPKSFKYTIIKYNFSKSAFSFLESPDFDSADEPLVGDSYHIKDNVVTFRNMGKDPFIYHHKWTMVKSSYKGFDVIESENRSKLWLSLANVDSSRIGRLSYWNKEVLPRIFKIQKQPTEDRHIGQYFVEFNKKQPTLYKSSQYAIYVLTKSDVSDILAAWDKHVWELRLKGHKKPTNKQYYHPTAIGRNKISAPIREYLKIKAKSNKNTLYHGVGRDEIGRLALAESCQEVACYDPYHPDEKVRKLTDVKYDEIHSHYTLNVVDKDEGFEVVKEIYSSMHQDGIAIISVRRDI